MKAAYALGTPLAARGVEHEKMHVTTACGAYVKGERRVCADREPLPRSPALNKRPETDTACGLRSVRGRRAHANMRQGVVCVHGPAREGAGST